MNNWFIISLSFIFVLVGISSAEGQSELKNHTLWDALLQQYVNNEGMVNYSGISKDDRFKTYLGLLSSNPPKADWKREEIMAFWINAYNAHTVELITKNPSVKSIMDIEKAWDVKFITIGGQSYSLNNIEHDVLRKQYFDARIHAAVNCASFSCPKLHNHAFNSGNVNLLLEKLCREFINDPLRNQLSGNSAKLSQLFDWYKDDFTKEGSLIDFINRYAKTPLKANADISYLEYNWTLNAIK